jgi:hypothetical protein
MPLRLIIHFVDRVGLSSVAWDDGTARDGLSSFLFEVNCPNTIPAGGLGCDLIGRKCSKTRNSSRAGLRQASSICLLNCKASLYHACASLLIETIDGSQPNAIYQHGLMVNSFLLAFQDDCTIKLHEKSDTASASIVARAKAQGRNG